jgi:hypothetical protein
MTQASRTLATINDALLTCNRMLRHVDALGLDVLKRPAELAAVAETAERVASRFDNVAAMEGVDEFTRARCRRLARKVNQQIIILRRAVAAIESNQGA